MARRTVGPRLGAGLLFGSAPMAAWWLIGDQSEGGRGADYYTLRPLEISFGDEQVFGVIAVVASVVGVALLLRSRHTLRARPTSWERAVLAVVVAEVVSMFIYRVMTAGTIGANIGAGMMLLFVVPIAAFVLAWALERAGSVVVVHGRTLSVASFVVSVTVIHFVVGIAVPWASPVFLAAVVFLVALKVVAADESGVATR